MSKINDLLNELDADVKWELDTPVQIDDSDLKAAKTCSKSRLVFHRPSQSPTTPRTPENDSYVLLKL